MRKEKLTIDGQIMHMRQKLGICFDIYDEELAKEFLMYNNYYFKIKSYAKNYEKYIRGANTGKYIDLDFAYLLELSRIDMYFRRVIIKMTLDIEHFLKTQLLRNFMENDNEDGYNIVKDLFSAYPYIKKNIDEKCKSSASRDLILKYNSNFAIWNIVEVLSFGDFIKLYEIYFKKYKARDDVINYLWSVKFLRNAAAHNNCLLNSLRVPYSNTIKPNKKINTFISKIAGINKDARKKKMKNPIIHDFVVMLYVFNIVVTSKNIKKHSMEELKDLIDNRFTVNKSYFIENQVLVSYYNFIKKIVDYFYGLWV